MLCEVKSHLIFDFFNQTLQFIEWLTSPEAQLLYTEVNYEYPVNPRINPSEEVAAWGKFKMDQVSLTDIAKNTPLAQMIINETGW